MDVWIDIKIQEPPVQAELGDVSQVVEVLCKDGSTAKCIYQYSRKVWIPWREVSHWRRLPQDVEYYELG